ncbi:hypothetical protein Q9295_16615 [Xinfangfangia sp. CPCC 101601]|uniref:Cellulose biosynthesis protein BcsS n=1 Tax=Pseudogemmobacter lacusdianii TaxID=3069608 RepID=A0ABU0W1W1_9RHOB|nr:hypothetical protein [Xinfangfangia sp. CPCC 101601]MDQ2067999.1 hypothetical protein [Xinfangfangia sp. CPCC 101601]
MRATLLPLFLMAAAPAQAFEVTGGSIGLSHSTLTSDESNNTSKNSITGQVELGFGGPVGVQIDAAKTNYNHYDQGSKHLMLHGFYRFASGTAVGAFIGRDETDYQSFDVKGLEFDHSFGQWSLEAYISQVSGDWMDGDVLGLRVDYSLNELAQIGLRYDDSSMHWSYLERIAITASYTLPHGIVVSGEFGTSEYEGQKDPFASLGVAYHFGKNGKTTFGSRNLSDIYPTVWGGGLG